MSQPPALGYSSGTYQPPEVGHLRALQICHYVWGGLVMFFSLFALIYVAMGIFLLTANFPAPTAAPAIYYPAGTVAMTSTTWPSGPTTGPVLAASPTPMPNPAPMVGWMFIIGGTVLFVLGMTLGALNLISARNIGRHASPVLSMVVAGINCISFPVGTTLGVFTFIILSKPPVRALYGK